MYKVFIENRAVEFVNSQKFQPILKGVPAFTIQDIQQDLINDLIALDPQETYFIFCNDIKFEWDRLFSGHQFVHAAGGVVVKNNKWLIIKRFGMLDLPKGHLDPNESPQQAAEREIKEECGIFPLQFNKFICSTYHTYFYEGKPVLKKTDWFLFNYFGDQEGDPQREEGIEEVGWLNPSEISGQQTQFYTSVQTVINETFQLLSESLSMKNR